MNGQRSLLVAALVLAPASAAWAQAVATIGGEEITRQELAEPLVRAHGLDMLLALAQLEAARAEANAAGLRVTDADVADERRRVVDEFARQLGNQAQGEDPEELLRLFLRRQQVSEAEFEIAMRTAAHLRKIVATDVSDQITPEALRRAFNVQYGEKVRVRHLAVPNLEFIADAQQRLEAGEAFAQVARAMSTVERTAAAGGEMPAFSRQVQNLPENFVAAAFALNEPGDVSAPVQADGSYHLIKLEEKIPPQGVAFEDVEDAIREQITDGFAQVLMEQKRQQLQQVVRTTIRIEDEELRRQFEDALAAARPREMSRDEFEQRMKRIRDEAARQQQEAGGSPGGEEAGGE